MNLIIILPLIAVMVVEILKFLIPSNKRPWKLSSLFTYSGMPSGHSALVTSLATIIGLQEGFSSALFGLAFIFAFLTMRDAMGLRQFLSRHGKTLNVLVKDLKNDDVLDKRYPKLIEKIGHTPAQVMVGSIIGIIIAIIGYYFF